jgi:hypothetical protein
MSSSYSKYLPRKGYSHWAMNDKVTRFGVSKHVLFVDVLPCTERVNIGGYHCKWVCVSEQRERKSNVVGCVSACGVFHRMTRPVSILRGVQMYLSP